MTIPLVVFFNFLVPLGHTCRLSWIQVFCCACSADLDYCVALIWAQHVQFDRLIEELPQQPLCCYWQLPCHCRCCVKAFREPSKKKKKKSSNFSRSLSLPRRFLWQSIISCPRCGPPAAINQNHIQPYMQQWSSLRFPSAYMASQPLLLSLDSGNAKA